ncbi:putative F-box domain-containing protein [Helianthus annuus]|nr:putative F-box domain-containing protein [Helianthus annuus]
MSDNIPFEIQELIMNKLPVEPLIRFRTVCKAWKSLIDSSDFIRNHIKQQNQQHLLVSSHGLLCLFGPDDKAVIWNPSIRKAVDVVLPDMVGDGIYVNVLGFGVCPETIDPKVIKIRIYTEDVIPWQVEVFTLSTRVWRSAYSSNVPSKCFCDRVDGRDGCGNLIVSFDLTSEEFGEVKLPDCLTYTHKLSMLKLRESLAVIEASLEEVDLGRGYDKRVYHIWRMKDGVPKLFEKLFSIDYSPDGSVVYIRGFRKTGEALLGWLAPPDFNRTLAAYEPYSKAITNLGINGSYISVYSFTETLLLLL